MGSPEELDYGITEIMDGGFGQRCSAPLRKSATVGGVQVFTLGTLIPQMQGDALITFISRG